MSRKKDPDFLSWESDIDLDDLLGDYTDNENETTNTAQTARNVISLCALSVQENIKVYRVFVDM